MKRKTLSERFGDKRFLVVFSILTAILLYFLIAFSDSTAILHTIRDVPISMDTQTALLSSLGLEVIEGDEYTTDITVRGSRTTVGKLTANSAQLATTVRFSEDLSPGTQPFQVVSAYTVGDLDFDIVSYSPRTVQVRLDRMKFVTLNIQPRVEGMATVSGFVYESEEASPAKVTVTGPEAEIARVATAEISLDITEELDGTIVRTRPIVLRDSQNEVIDPDANHLNLDVDEAQLIITVLKETGLPIEVGFIAPTGFPVDLLREYMGMSVDYVTIRGPADTVDSLTEIHVGYINIKDLHPGNSTFNFPLGLKEISEQIRSTDNVNSVGVYFDIPDWETAEFNIRGIEMRNVPSDLNVELMSDFIDGVVFAGTQTALEGMTSEDIVAWVDLSDRVLTSGQFSYPVKISVPSKGLVWAIGDEHNVVIRVTEKE